MFFSPRINGNKLCPSPITLIIVLTYLAEEVASSGAVLRTPELLLLVWCALVRRFTCRFTLCAHATHIIVRIWFLCVLGSVSL